MTGIDYTRLLSRLDPTPDGEAPVRHRSAEVDVVNSDGTVDIILSGVVVPDVAVLQGAYLTAGETVQVVSWGGDLLVLDRVRSDALPPVVGVSGQAQGSVSVVNITVTKLALDTATVDQGAWLDAANNRILVGERGWYQAEAWIHFASDTDGLRRIGYVFVNGAEVRSAHEHGIEAAAIRLQVIYPFYHVGGSTLDIDFRCFHDAGNNLDCDVRGYSLVRFG